MCAIFAKVNKETRLKDVLTMKYKYGCCLDLTPWLQREVPTVGAAELCKPPMGGPRQEGNTVTDKWREGRQKTFLWTTFAATGADARRGSCVGLFGAAQVCF